MLLLEVLKILHELAQKSENHRLESGESIVFEFKYRDKIKKSLDKSGIECEIIGEDELAVNLTQHPGLFYNCEHLLRESVNNKIFNSNIGILLYTDGKYLYYQHSSGKSYVGTDEVDEKDNFIQNTQYYWKFHDYFKPPNISEYHSTENREFVLFAPEKGKFLLGYPAVPPNFPKGMSLKSKYLELTKISSLEFRLYFEMQIIESLSTYDHDQKFPKLIENLETIIRKSENNYKVYLNKFSFEKLKRDFRKERDEYFSNIRTIVDQLLGKVVTIPVSISAAALAMYESKDDPRYSIVVVVAYVIYSLFSSYFLRLFHVDVLEIKQDLDNDIVIIKDKSNIPEDELKTEITKVNKKISLLHNTIIILQFLLAGLSLAVLEVFFQLVVLPPKWIVLILLLVLDLHFLTSFGWISKTIFSVWEVHRGHDKKYP